MTYYAIDTWEGTQITTGLPAHTARATAQRIANERGEAVYLYDPLSKDEAEEVRPVEAGAEETEEA